MRMISGGKWAPLKLIAIVALLLFVLAHLNGRSYPKCVPNENLRQNPGETRKRLGLFGILAPGHQRLGGHWASCSRLRWPQPIEHQEHPHQDDQPELVENKMGYHGTAPSHRWEKGHCTGFLDGWNYPQATGTLPCEPRHRICVTVLTP